MIQRLSVLLSLAIATPSLPHVASHEPLAAHERSALAALESLPLAAQTAGAAGEVHALDASSRETLRALQNAQPLEDMRAGDLEVSNHDLSTILLVLGILVLVGILI